MAVQSNQHLSPSSPTFAPNYAYTAPLAAKHFSQGIHKLPPEVMSRIFILGQESEQSMGQNPRVTWYLGFQDIATQVCSYWRSVALDTPIIWTNIHITSPTEHHLAFLYISRAGPKYPLDINLEVRTRFQNRVNTIFGVRGAHTFVDLEKYYVHGVFRTLNDHGAGRHRWRSLSICSNELSTLFVILDFLYRHPVPDLTVLALKWKRGASLPTAFKHSLNFDLPNRLHHAFELWKKIERELFLPNVITLSNLLTPKLGCLRLDMGAPSSPKLWPLFKNLTSLSLIPLYILTTLDISSFHCQQDGIPCLLSNMPGVHNLSICGCYAKVLNRLWVLPRLSELTISVCELTPESAHRHLRRALRSRAKVGYPDILVQLPADWKARIESKYQNPGRVLLMEYLSPAMAEPPYPESEDEEVDD